VEITTDMTVEEKNEVGTRVTLVEAVFSPLPLALAFGQHPIVLLVIVMIITTLQSS
jgi:hypothetical protein